MTDNTSNSRPANLPTEAGLALARRNMIEQQIRTWDVLDARVLQTLEVVRRECFVPDGLKALAFVDTELPLPAGQFMLAPKLEARIVQELDLLKTDQVLEIGAGTGHQAALMAHLAASVTTLEREPELAALARANLEACGITNVTVVEADGLTPDAGWSGREYDVIVLSGGVQELPEFLPSLLRPGGRLLAFVGRAPVQEAILIEHRGASQVQTTLFETLIPELVCQAREPDFQF